MSKLPDLINLFILIALCINVLLNTNGVNGQDVKLIAPGHITTCSVGLREEKDNYTFKGILNNTGANWPKSAYFQISVNNADFTPVCYVVLLGCASSTDKCYCASSSGDIYEMVLNVKANKSESEAKIRIQWADSTVSNFVVSNNVTVPKIYDVKAVTTLLTIDGAPVVCPQSISSKSNIKFQCLNSPQPCGINISLDNSLIASHDETITYRVPETLLPNTSHVLEFSYSVCGESASKVSCLVTIVSAQSSTLTCNTLGVALSVIFFIGIMIMIAPAIILYIAVVMIYKAGISIFDFITSSHRKKVTSYSCIGSCTLGSILDAVLIIVFNQKDLCICDGSEDCIALLYWLILLIIFCIIIALLLIGILAVIIHERSRKDSQKLKSETGSLKDNTSSTDTGKEKQEDENLALQEHRKRNPSENHDTIDETRTEISDDKNPAKRSSKKRSKGKRQEKAKSTKKRELPLPNTNDTVSGK